MYVDQEVAVGAVLVLADFGADQRRAAQSRESAVAGSDDLVDRGLRRSAVLGVGIDEDAVLVVRELDPAIFEVGKAVKNVAGVEVRPARHRGGRVIFVAGRLGEIEDLLTRGEDLLAEQVRKYFRKPW